MFLAKRYRFVPLKVEITQFMSHVLTLAPVNLTTLLENNAELLPEACCGSYTSSSLFCDLKATCRFTSACADGVASQVWVGVRKVRFGLSGGVVSQRPTLPIKGASLAPAKTGKFNFALFFLKKKIRSPDRLVMLTLL